MRNSARCALTAGVLAAVPLVSEGSGRATTVPVDEDATFAGLFLIGDHP